MARLTNGTSDTLTAASVDLSATNFISVSFWLWWDSFANDNDFAMEFTADTGANNGFAFNPNHVSGSWSIAWNLSGGASVSQRLFSRPSAAAWHHYLIMMDGRDNPDSASVYVDGSAESLSLGINFDGTGNFANSTLYLFSRAGSTLFGAGRMAELAIWPGLILVPAGGSDALAIALSKGVSPLMIRPDVKPYYWPLQGRQSPEPELFYGSTAALTGTSTADHPRIIYAASPDIGARIAGPITETISPAGSLTPAGALVRQPAFYPAGTLTPLGSFTTTTPRTRLYFSSTLPANVSPAYNGGWTYTTQASRWRLNNVKAASAMADGTRIAWTSSGAEIALDRQYVSNILNGAQSVGGIVKMQLLCREFQNSDNVNEVYLTVYVVSGDGSTVRGEILPLDEYSAVTELLHSGYRNKTFVVNHGGVVAAQDGDRIVVEFGYSAATVTTTPEARGRFGENAADLAENETDTADGAGWIEMAGTLAFIAIGSNEIAPAGTATPAGAVRKTVGKVL